MSGSGLKQLERIVFYLKNSPQKIPGFFKLAYRTRILKASQLRRSGQNAQLPPLMTLTVNKRCNLRCVQCWEWGKNGAFLNETPETLRDELSTREWLSLIDEASAWKPYLYFIGGEPLLRKDICELISAASRLGMLTSLNTNMTLITPALADKIVLSGLDYLIASLDGPQEVNDRIRIGNDVYNKVMTGLEALMAAKKRHRSLLPMIEVCTTLTAENQDHLVETAELVDRLKVDYFRIQFGTFTTPELLKQTEERMVREFNARPKLFAGFVRDVSDIDPVRVEAAENEILNREWNFQYKRYPKGEVQGFNSTEYFRSPSRVFGEGKCHVPWKRAVIQPNGEVSGCAWLPEAKIGNIRQSSFRNLWNSPPMQAFRNDLDKNGLFPTCSRCCDLYELDESRRFTSLKN